MARFHDLTVTHIHKTIRDAVVLTLQPVNVSTGEFGFEPGQYLTFKQDFDGQEIRRNYSICAGLQDGVLQVGIKKVAGGAFSTWANDSLQVGDTLQAMPPMGRFTTEISPQNANHYLGFAGGSGITPVLSLLKSTLGAEPDSQFTLIYANRGVNTIMFREELEDLKNQYMGRLTILHVLESDAQDIDLFTGRVDAEKCAKLFEGWIDITSVDTAFICGPEPMMLAIAAALKDHGLKEGQIKFELFTSGQPGQLPRKELPEGAEAQPGTQITVRMDGTSRSFEMPAGMTVLEAALDHNLDAPFACKAGVCSTCMCKLVEGEVEMAANHALEDYEVERGYILSCQSFPLTDKIVVDYDLH